MESKHILTKVLATSLKKVMILGALMSVLGIVAIIYPEGFGKFSVTIIGVFMIIGGLLRLLFAIASFSMGTLFLRYLYGIIMIVVGCFIIGNPNMGLEALTVIMAVYFILDGITQFIFSFLLVPVGGGMYMLFSGIIGIAIGLLIFMHWPEASSYAIGIYLGVKLLIDGVTLVLTGDAVIKTAKLESQYF